MTPLDSGARLGPYTIVARLGAGGMGEVFRAHDPRLGRDVALKVLPEAFARDAGRLARFEREARMVAGLNHPSIVTLYTIEEEAGVRFLTMELIEGECLGDLIAPGGLAVEKVLDLAIPLADALVAAHGKGVIHRDLKPGNLMVTGDGRIKVLDFGLAKSVEADPSPDLSRAPTMESPLSSAGHVLGTIPYMAPEQVRGEDVDARTDVFALGIILYELATGRRPFKGSTAADVASSILRDVPPLPSAVRAGLPADLDRIVGRCLEKDAADRFQSALDVHRELRLFRRALERGATDGAREQPSIAVLPFSNMSADPENEYFSDGLTEELLNVLAKVPELKVAGRTSSFAFKDKHEDVRAIGHKLGVSTLLEGSVRRAGNRVRITAQLVKAADGFHLWSETYDRVLDDIFAVQDDIAKAVSSALHVKLLGKSTAGPRGSAESYELLMRANHLTRQNTGPLLEKAVGLYQMAIDKSPEDARAWAGLSMAHIHRAFYGHADVAESRRLARETAERALSLDEGLVKAHLVMGIVLGSLEYRLKEAMTQFRRALALAPGSADAIGTMGVYLSLLGRVEEGLGMLRKAVEIDPLDAGAHLNRSRVEGWAGHTETAIECVQRALELSPEMGFLHSSIGLHYLNLGRIEEAFAEIERESAPGYRDCALGIAYETIGKRDESDRALARLMGYGENWAFQVAIVYGARGEADETFRWLDRSYELMDSGLILAKMSPWFRSVHTDPRWPKFLEKVGLGD